MNSECSVIYKNLFLNPFGVFYVWSSYCVSFLSHIFVSRLKSLRLSQLQNLNSFLSLILEAWIERVLSRSSSSFSEENPHGCHGLDCVRAADGTHGTEVLKTPDALYVWTCLCPLQECVLLVKRWRSIILEGLIKTKAASVGWGTGNRRVARTCVCMCVCVFVCSCFQVQ